MLVPLLWEPQLALICCTMGQRQSAVMHACESSHAKQPHTSTGSVVQQPFSCPCDSSHS